MNYSTKKTALAINGWDDIPDNFTGIAKDIENYLWLVNRKLHRDDGPAKEWADGSKEWYLNGKLHRDDGPAAIYSDGKKYWFLNDEYYSSQEEWFDKLTSEQKEKALWNMDNW